MKAKEHLEAGDLSGALQELNQAVKSRPTDVELRTFLFELLCFSGEFDRAQRQLEVLNHQEEEVRLGVELHQNLLNAEHDRHQFYVTGKPPHFPLGNPEYIEAHIQAMTLLRENNTLGAKALLDQADILSPSLQGQVDGKDFSEFLDGADEQSSLLEAFVENQYAWIPFEHIKQLSIQTPRFLRDLLWIPAKLEPQQGMTLNIFIPVLYQHSWQSDNDLIRLGRLTQWQDLGQTIIRGQGQRAFIVDGEEKALLTMREIQFIPQSSTLST